MVAINFLFQLVSRHANLIGIDDDDVISAIQIRSVIRFILADQDARNARRHTAQNQSRGVHHKPSAALFDRFSVPPTGNVRTHEFSHTFP